MSNEITNWEKELAELALATCETEKHMTQSNQFISINKQGELLLYDMPLVNNEAIVIITDHIIEQAFYAHRFDVNNIVSPECYAFGRTERELKPHEAITHPIATDCTGCPNYQWGSAEGGIGKGKACATKRRLSMVLAGTRAKDGTFTPATIDDLKMAETYYMRIPVMSVRNFSSYVTKLSISTKRPPFAVYTKIKVNTSKTYNTIEFTCEGKVPDDFLPVLLERHKQAQQTIMFPYSKNDVQYSPPHQPAPTAQPVAPPLPAHPQQPIPQQPASVEHDFKF